MKTVELTEKQYKVLLDLKNYITFKTRTITNPEITNHLVDITDPDYEEKLKKPHGIPAKAWTTINFEPEYSFGECITDIVLCIWDEQKTGNVNAIT